MNTTPSKSLLDHFIKVENTSKGNEIKSLIGGFQLLESELLLKKLDDHFEKDRTLNQEVQ